MSEQPAHVSIPTPGKDVDPDELVRRIKAYLEQLKRCGPSDPAAQGEWERFYRECAPILARLAGGYRQSGEDCADRVQDLWLTLLIRLPEFRYDSLMGDLHDWISVVAAHRLVDQHRAWRRRAAESLPPRAAERLVSREPDPADAFERDRLRHLVRDALEELREVVAPRDYKAFTMRWMESLSVREIAERLGMTEVQIWSSHHRTSLKLRPLLARRLFPKA